jgi:hypothetical protein
VAQNEERKCSGSEAGGGKLKPLAQCVVLWRSTPSLDRVLAEVTTKFRVTSLSLVLCAESDEMREWSGAINGRAG